MQKIILTQKTMGVIIDRLRKITAGFYTVLEAENVHPLKCKSWRDSGLSDRAMFADVTVHWMQKNTEHPVLSGRDKNEVGFPMIHLAIDAECAMCFSIGDVFYFKGNTIIVNQTSGSTLACTEGAKNITYKITVEKWCNALTPAEINFVMETKAQTAANTDWLEELADNTANGFHEFWEKELLY